MNSRTDVGTVEGDGALESLLRFLPTLLLRGKGSDGVVDIGARAGDCFFCNELRGRLIRPAGCGECVTIGIVERGVRSVAGLLREAENRLEVGDSFY